MRPARLRRATPQANRVAYTGEGLQEWWRALPIGYEQGFTIDRAPSGSGPIMLEIEFSVAPTMEHGTLRWGAIRYGKLYVTDARGRVLPARLSAHGRMVRLSFDAAGARFPVTVDPLVWVQSQALLASPSGLGTRFGSAIAYSANGHVALIGTPGGGGAAFLFENVAGLWSHFTPLLPDDGTSSDAFGYSVALSADGATAIVGAETKTVGSNAMQGAAYIFTRATQVAKLTASDGAPSDYFGMAVALSSDGTTAMVGAPDKTVGANAAQGAVYVYGLSGGAWTQTAELTGADGAAYDYFGESLALARNAPTLLIGAQYKTVNAASYAGAAYVFTGTGGTWSQTGEFDGGGIDGGYFGHAVALSADGSVALVGALFTNVGANTAQGAAYVFGLAGGVWSQSAQLVATDAAAQDDFGSSVALSSDGNTALVGAMHKSINGNVGQGAAYIFSDVGGNWSQSMEFSIPDGAAQDRFGTSAAMSADGATAFIGAPGRTLGTGVSLGTVYVFGAADLSSALSVPALAVSGNTYSAQYIVTNNSASMGPLLDFELPVPANATYVSATASQGSCSYDSAKLDVTCLVGSPAANGGSLSATVTLTASGSAGASIQQSAHLLDASPDLAQSGTTTITPDAPAIGGLVDVTVTQPNAGTERFTVSGSGALKLTATSSNTTLLPNANITGAASCTAAGNCVLTLTPASGEQGSVTVTVTVTDSYGQSGSNTFLVTVNPKPSGSTSTGSSGGGGGGAIGPTGLLLLAGLALAAARQRRRIGRSC